MRRRFNEAGPQGAGNGRVTTNTDHPYCLSFNEAGPQGAGNGAPPMLLATTWRIGFNEAGPQGAGNGQITQPSVDHDPLLQ